MNPSGPETLCLADTHGEEHDEDDEHGDEVEDGHKDGVDPVLQNGWVGGEWVGGGESEFCSHTDEVENAAREEKADGLRLMLEQGEQGEQGVGIKRGKMGPYVAKVPCISDFVYNP